MINTKPPSLATITNLPKVELHAHLSASMTRASFKKLLVSKGIEQDLSSFNCKDSADAFNRIFKLLGQIIQTKADLQFLAREVFNGFKSENVVYLEIRSTPKPLKDINPKQYIDAVIEVMKEFQDSITVRYLLSINRAYPPEAYKDIFDELQVNKEWQKWTVGIDLSGDPLKGDVDQFKQYFSVARNLGMKLSLHTAEVSGAAKETPRILELEPERVGHFLFGTDDELRILEERGTVIEVCPSSNMVTIGMKSMQEHPMPRFVQKGCKVVICTDDILLFDQNLSEQIHLVCESFDLGVEFCKKITLDGLDGAFVEDEIRQRLKGAVIEAYKKFE